MKLAPVRLPGRIGANFLVSRIYNSCRDTRQPQVDETEALRRLLEGRRALLVLPFPIAARIRVEEALDARGMMMLLRGF